MPWLALVVAGVGVVAGACGSPSNPDALGGGSGEDASAGGSSGGGSCAKPGTGCACSTAGEQVACGEVDTNEGSFVTCSEGTRTCSGGKWGACVGTVKVIKSTGSLTSSGFHAYTNGVATDGGACTLDPCDPTCEAFSIDNSNGIDAGGLTATDAGGWTLPLSLGDGGTCSGLQCSVPACSGGQTTTVTGIVLDPAGVNPVYNAIVMIPNAGAAAVQPIAAGVSSDPCGGAPLPVATTFTSSATNGTFTLTGVPVGASIPLVIQIGRWRRITTINTSSLTCGHSLNITPTPPTVGATCEVANNYAGNANCPTRLPRVQSEGNIPLTAIGTGGLDAMECMLYRMGVDSSMFTDETRGGRIHVFNDGGAQLASPNANHDVSWLMGFTCPAGNGCPVGTLTGTSTTNITNPSFETASLTGWTISGATVTSSTVQVEAGSRSALEGATTPTNGDSTVTQTMTAPAGVSVLSFWVYMDCNDTVQYDWFTASLKDNTTNVTQTVPAECPSGSANRAWTNYVFNVNAGDNYTLKLTSHDDDYAADPSWAYVDNIQWGVLSGVTNLLPNYDLVLLPCDGGAEYYSGGATNWGNGSYDDPGRVNLVNYANVGGRVFTSHWGREWIERTSSAIPSGPFPSVANWIGDTTISGGGAVTGVINSGTAWGTPFKAWMNAVGATAGNTFTINPNRIDTSSVTANSELYAYYQTGNYPADFVFNTPVGSSNPVGRVMYTDMHLANGTPSGTFPGNCPTQGSALLQQEDAAEYLLFDLAGCVSGAPPPGNPQVYSPATFTRDFQGTCPTGSQVVWQNFYWADTTPGNSSVVFTAWTADSEAQLGTQYPMAPLATANGANSCPNGPSCSNTPILNGTNPGVAVDTDLAANGTPTTNMPPVASHAWLRVNMTLNPTSDQMTAPTLEGWQQTYGCVSSE